MSDSSATLALEAFLVRMNAGDRAARDELLRHVAGRLERLARKMLRQFPSVRRWAQTDDVLQGALIRLVRSLEDIRPASLREFFGLATTQIRRELIDLARKYYGPEGVGANHASRVGSDADPSPLEQADRTDDQTALVCWQEFHERVRDLPEAAREVFELLYYQGLTQQEAASLLVVSLKTVQRRWHESLATLEEWLKGNWPGV